MRLVNCLGVVVITPWPSDKIRPVGVSYTFLAVDTGGDLRRTVAHQVQRGWVGGSQVGGSHKAIPRRQD